MQNRISITNFAFAASLLLLLFFSSGCGKNSQQPDAQLQLAQQQQAEEKESEKLKNIETRLETLIEILGGPSVKTEENEGEKDGGSGQEDEGTQQKGKQQQSTQQQGKQNKGTQQQSTQQQSTQQQSTQQQQDAEKWSEIDMIISNLHYQWNDFMPEIAKKGADMKLVDNFDNALNSLTTTVETNESGKILSAANALYSYIPDLYSLYRVKMSPEAKRMIYYTRSIIFEAAKENWEQAKKDDEAMEKSWSLLRNTLEKEQQQIDDKLDFSIYELKKVVSEKNKQLTNIKGRIVLSNIKELQKSFEEKK